MVTDALSGKPLQAKAVKRLRKWLKENVSKALETQSSENPTEALTRKYLEKAYKHSKANLPENVKSLLIDALVGDIVGLGPIQSLLDDPTITEVMINAPDQIYVERRGKLERSGISFEDEAAVEDLIDRIISPLGRRLNSDHPTVDGRLPDGSRVNVVIPPVAIDGPGVTIRKFAHDQLHIDDLIGFGSLSPHMGQFLEACVVARLNILVSGGTGSGKTTLLNIISEFIPDGERIVTIEDAAELQLHQDHIFRLETKPPNVDGSGEVSIRHLVRNALRMRPDRIIVGEVRGGEALDMLQAMNTGHDGSLTTLHANSPRDGISRLETMVLLAGIDFPLKVVREQIASAVDLIVQQSRIRDGSRKVTSITEVIGMEGEIVVLNEIFNFQETGVDEGGQVVGEFSPTGRRPMFESRLEAAGYKLAPEVFGVDLMKTHPPQRRSRR